MANFFRTPLPQKIKREIQLFRIYLFARKQGKIEKLETDVEREEQKVKLLQLKLKKKQLKQKKKKLKRKLRF